MNISSSPLLMSQDRDGFKNDFYVKEPSKLYV